MMYRLLLVITLALFSQITLAENSSNQSSTSEQVESDPYQNYLIHTQGVINKRFPGFFSDLSHKDQLKWIDYVGNQGVKYGYENMNLRQQFTLIACYLGKDFMANDEVDKDIKRFLQDDRFSKYVRVRDMRRYLKRKGYTATPPNLD
ncbi:hypothetical protein [Kangiella spongicola]|uniref:Uncharacterized protein n=1 Tax=Kangiella spongicola TaxID=796379 RepID=A0A318D579_9GAMM|nr:hypothetical protein [Kangiella spongicola]PXF64396.1 hypothetical protein DL796_04450 [Kangiella spongicola]